MAKQVMDIDIAKSFTQRQSDEHKRNWNDEKWQKVTSYGSYDRTRAGLNFEIIDGKIVPLDPNRSIPEAIRKTLDERGIKDPNAGRKVPIYRTIVNLILGGSREQMHRLAYGEQQVDLTKGADNSHITRHKEIEDWALDMYHFMTDKYGQENIVSFVVHLDETNPHIHCTLLPILNNKFAFKKIFAGKDREEFRRRSLKLHDELAAVNRRHGLERGDSVGVTKAGHRTTEEYKYQLSRECIDLEEQAKKTQELVYALRKEVAHCEKRVKGLTTMIANLEHKKSDLETEISGLEDQLRAGQGNTDDLQRRIDLLKSEYETVNASLSDKRAKLVEANRKLDEFRELETESKEKIEEYREQEQEYRDSLKDITKDMSQQIQFRINDTAMSEVIREVKMILPNLGDARFAFSNSLLDDIANGGENVLKCAAMLLAGYVDGATTFAQTHGGSGGPGSGWGKKDDEDDNAFRRRCLFQAARMMRPSGGKTIKRK